jgi:hypothetical protein
MYYNYNNIPTLEIWQNDSKDFPTVSTSRTAAILEAWGTPRAQIMATAKAPPTPEFSSSLGAVDRTFKVSATLVRGSLKEIDELIAMYQLAYDPMAKTNVLNDLRRAIDKWSHKQPHLPEAMEALRRVVDRELNLRSPAARYKKAICIAFKIPCNYNKKDDKAYDNSDMNKDYFRWDQNDAVDMKIKCKNLWAQIELARSGIASQGLADDNRTLKIFMAPEFYFRGRNGAYSPDIVSDIIPYMKALGTASPLYQDWLFVFGTAVASIEIANDLCAECNRYDVITYKADPVYLRSQIAVCTNNASHRTYKYTHSAEVQNVALIQHGAITHMVVKEYKSNIDYKGNQVWIRRDIPGEARLVPAVSPLGGVENPGHPTSGMIMHSDERLGGCIFTVDGLTIGLEVCLDHKANNWKGQIGRASKLAHMIQILLIPSYGMAIGDGLFTKPNGILFNVDGRGEGSSEVKLNVTPYQSKNARPVGDHISLYGPFAIPA